MERDNNFRMSFRAEMDEFRKELQNGKLDNTLCNARGDAHGDAQVHRDAKCETRSEEFHGMNVDVHRDINANAAEEDRNIGYENEEGGF